MIMMMMMTVIIIIYILPCSRTLLGKEVMNKKTKLIDKANFSI